MPIMRERLQCHVIINRGNIRHVHIFIPCSNAGFAAEQDPHKHHLISEQFPKNILQRKIYWYLRQKHVQSLSLPNFCQNNRWEWLSLILSLQNFGRLWKNLDREVIRLTFRSGKSTHNNKEYMRKTNAIFKHWAHWPSEREWVFLRTCSVCCWQWGRVQYIDFSQLVSKPP